MHKPALPKFQVEPGSVAFIEEAIPLFVLHYKQIAHYQDIQLKPDYDYYLKLVELGMIRVFTAREEGGELIGYSIHFVRNNLHYSGSKQAVQDILFIHPEKRGFGGKFLEWCDQQLRAEGVQVSYHHVKARSDLNFGSLLERMGYQLVDQVYGRRLDKDGA